MNGGRLIDRVNTIIMNADTVGHIYFFFSPYFLASTANSCTEQFFATPAHTPMQRNISCE